MFKRQIMVFAVVFSLAFALTSWAQAQTVIGFLGPDPANLAAGDTLPSDADTAKVAAVGAVILQTAITGGDSIYPTLLPAPPNDRVSYLVRAIKLHKVASDDKGPESGYIWIPLTTDPGRSRWTGGLVILPDGPAADGNVTMLSTTGQPFLGRTVALLGDPVEPVTLLCPTCGELLVVRPVIGADGDLLNDLCPACGSTMVTADTLTVE